MKNFISKITEKKSGAVLLYSGLFVLLSLVCFLPFLFEGNGFLWVSSGGGGGKDGYYQHYNALVYLGRWLRGIFSTLFTEGKFIVPMWDFSIGYGSDIVTTMNYYAFGDPLNLTSVFVPSQYTEYLYYFLVVLRLYLSGVAFSLFCFRMQKNRLGTVAGALAYVFCGFALYNGVRHPFFINPMIYLPLILLGAEKILKKEKPLLFVFMIFISAISNYYFLYMIIFALVLYVAIRYFTMEREKSVKDAFFTIGKFFGCGLLGIGMASTIILPTIGTFMISNRLKQGGGSVELLYEPAYYEKIFADMFSGNPPYHGTFYALAPVIFVALVVLYMSRKKYIGLKIAVPVLGFMLMFPVFGKIMNGFSYVTNRWSFIFAGLMAYVLVSVLEDMITLSKKKLAVLGLSVSLYLGFLLTFHERVTKATCISFGLILAVVVILALNYKGYLKKLGKNFVAATLVAITVLGIAFNGYFTYNQGALPYITEFNTLGEAYDGLYSSADAAAAKLIDKNSFARNEQSKTTDENASSITGSMGTQFYWSLENGNISQYLMDNGKNKMLAQMYDGLDGRAFLHAPAAVKYYIQTDDRQVPYGYEKYKDVTAGEKTYEVYKNNYALPLGYTYDSYISRSDYNKMSVGERQQAVLQSVVLEDGKNPENFTTGTPVFTHQEMKCKIKKSKGVVIRKDGTYLINKRNAKVTFIFEGLPDSETYLFVEDMYAETRDLYELYHDDCNKYLSKKDFNKLKKSVREKIKNQHFYSKKDSKADARLVLGVKGELINSSLMYCHPEYKRACGQKDFMVNMGYSKEGQSKITVKFQRAGVYRFGDIGVICQPMESYRNLVEERRQDVLVNEKLSTNRVQGDITLTEDKILCLSIPYSTGWTSTVDGKKTELLQANGMFMALPLSAGTHSISLSYTTPFMVEGLIVTFLSWIIFIAIAIIGRLRKKRSLSLRVDTKTSNDN